MLQLCVTVMSVTMVSVTMMYVTVMYVTVVYITLVYVTTVYITMVDVRVVCYSDVCYTGVCYRDGSRVVFIGSHSHQFVALHLSSGHVIWRVQLGGRIEGSACLSKCARFIMVGRCLLR